MSKPNKANKTNYTQAGRLTPDEMARERMKGAGRDVPPTEQMHITGKTPPIPGEREPTRPRSAPEE
jgi:hypothetical protein